MMQGRSMREGVNIRLPEGMREQIRERAAANRRSMNAEIVYWLDRLLNADSNVDRREGSQ